MRKPFDKFAKWREAQVAEWHCRVGKITRKVAAKVSRKPRQAKPAPVLRVAADERAHLQPGWVSPAAARPPKQRWANWVRSWRPMSLAGKAAKAGSWGPVTWGWTVASSWQKNAMRDLLSADTDVHHFDRAAAQSEAA